MHDTAPQLVAEPAAADAGLERESFLDALRTLALMRVILWHTFGAAVITYFVAAVPAMFFVTGSLLAKSLSHRGARQVVVDRLRRILVPLWAFGLVIWVAMAVARAADDTTHTALAWRNLAWWVLPLNDPKGSAWEGGYSSAPLWYLRVLVWLFVLGPVLLRLVRRVPALAIGIPLAGVLVLEVLDRRGTWNGSVAWHLGDLALYSLFLMAGFLQRLGRFDRVSRGHWLVISVAAAVASGVWLVAFPPPGHVVNDSHLAHLLVGVTWLTLMLAARPLVEAFVARRHPRAFISWVSKRTMSIYLWHSTAVLLVFELLRGNDLPVGLHSVILLAGTAVVTFVIVVAVGWIEDLANKRPPRLWPTASEPLRWPVRSVPATARASLAVGLGVLLFAGGAAVNSLEAAGSTACAASQAGGATVSTPELRVPSRQPTAAAPQADGGSSDGSVLGTDLLPDAEVAAPAALSGVMERWLKDNSVRGAQIAVYRPGVLDWCGGFGVDDQGAPVQRDARFDIASVTKTFTAALVWREIDALNIHPDAPLPHIDAIADFPYFDQITPRMLLSHRSGLIDYWDTPEFAEHPEALVPPAQAIEAVGRQPLRSEPGSQTYYATVNYLILGLLLEQVTGQPYDVLLQPLLDSAGLHHVTHRGVVPGSSGFSAAGLTMDSDTLAHWGVALLHDNVAHLTDTSRAAMAAFDPDTGIGAGLWSYCPCTTDENGVTHREAIGHSGSTTVMQYFPDRQLAIVVNLYGSIWVPDGREAAVGDLFNQLRSALYPAR